LKALRFWGARERLPPCPAFPAAGPGGNVRRPRDGTVAAAPKAVRLSFSERLDPAASALDVENAAGKRMDLGNAGLDPHDPAVLYVSLKALAAGRYKVRWRAVSVDGHAAEGDFEFTVAP